MTVLERFMAKIDVRGDDECWPWTANRDEHGYGRFGYEGRNRFAHRVGYELLVGPIPKGLQLDHLCRTRHCVNPAHLEPVTQRENILRGEGMAARHARSELCVHGHPKGHLRRDSRGGMRRVCLVCERQNGRRYRDRLKAAA